MSSRIDELATGHCKPCEGGVMPMSPETAAVHLTALPGWQLVDSRIFKQYEFKSFLQTMAFVNAVAWVAQRENHHPQLEIAFRSCRVSYSTHAIAGLSENDFICAAKVELLVVD